jgi:hypothetical protein
MPIVVAPSSVATTRTARMPTSQAWSGADGRGAHRQSSGPHRQSSGPERHTDVPDRKRQDRRALGQTRRGWTDATARTGPRLICQTGLEVITAPAPLNRLGSHQATLAIKGAASIAREPLAMRAYRLPTGNPSAPRRAIRGLPKRALSANPNDHGGRRILD